MKPRLGAWAAAVLFTSGSIFAEQHALNPDEALKTFRPAPGFQVEQFAAEPHVVDPVSISFDADGRAYVAEMLDYPFVRTEKMFGPFPEEQIRFIEDSDGDGKVARFFCRGVAAGAACRWRLGHGQHPPPPRTMCSQRCS